MTHATTTRLHRCLVHALRSSRPESPDRPITVAEIYQDLVPYRAVRSALGIELNADYEDALVRLLSGEGGHVRLEPSEARDELRRELELPNPDIGLYRKFAACDVWVDLNVPDADSRADPSRSPGSTDLTRASPIEPPAGSAAEASGPHAADRLAPSPGTGGSPELRRGGELRDLLGAAGLADPRSAGVSLGSSPEGSTCLFCQSTLPSNRTVRYCPFCGADQSHRPCPGCGEVLELAWRYCVACGADVSAEGSAPAM